MNEIVRRCMKPGSGLFIKELIRALKRRGHTAPFFAHDLIAELDGKPSTVTLPLALQGADVIAGKPAT
jgi:hypothetical protein